MTGGVRAALARAKSRAFGKSDRYSVTPTKRNDRRLPPAHLSPQHARAGDVFVDPQRVDARRRSRDQVGDAVAPVGQAVVFLRPSPARARGPTRTAGSRTGSRYPAKWWPVCAERTPGLMPTNSARIGRRTRSRSGFTVSLRAMTASSLPIRADGVTKRFGKTLALDNVSLQVGRGEIFGLLGPNGAGKTTLIRTILDIIKPDTGRLELFGRLFQPADRDRIGYLPEERGLYPRQPVGAVLEYMGTLKGMTRADARAEAARWLERLGLADASGTESRAAVEGQPAEGAACRDAPRRAGDRHSRRAAVGPRPGQRTARDRRHSRLRRRRTHRAAVDAPDGDGRVAVHARDDDRARTRRARRRAARDQAAVLEQRHPRAVDRRLPIVSARRAGRRRASADGFVDVHLRPPASGDDFLHWLVADRRARRALRAAVDAARGDLRPGRDRARPWRTS